MGGREPWSDESASSNSEYDDAVGEAIDCAPGAEVGDCWGVGKNLESLVADGAGDDTGTVTVGVKARTGVGALGAGGAAKTCDQC